MRTILLIALLLATPALSAADPKIENITATAEGGRVSIRFHLANAFQNGEMVQGLQSGVPTSFTYTIEIFRDRPNWFDDDLDRSRIDVICTFNSLTREYLLNYRRDKKLVRSETFTDLADLERRMTTIEEADLFDIGGRKPYKLKVRVKADLSRGHVMYVIPWSDSTRWREARVKRAGAP
ncbi:MAG TPA: DUF4390 domain-containing protein [Thermoanaerobaculia bacterium]